MRKKQWILLLVVLAAFVAATAGMRGYQNKQDKKEAQKEEAEKVYALQFSSDDVTGIAYEKDGEWLAFTKNDASWHCETDTAAAIDGDKMKTMLSSLGSMTADNTVESPADIAQYGLDEPSMQAILTFADGSEKTLNKSVDDLTVDETEDATDTTENTTGDQTDVQSDDTSENSSAGSDISVDGVE